MPNIRTITSATHVAYADEIIIVASNQATVINLSQMAPKYLELQIINANSSGTVTTSPATQSIPVGTSLSLLYDGSTWRAAGKVDSDITWVADELHLDVGSNGTAQLEAEGAGAQLLISAADGDSTHVGGELQLRSGNSVDNNGGDLTIAAGDDQGIGDGGNITIKSGFASNGSNGGGNGGSITIAANPLGAADSQGGQVVINGGAGRTGGGSVIITPGARTVSGSHGTLQLYSADSNNSIELNNSGVFVTAPVLSISEVAKLEPQAFASLPASPEEGMMAWVNNSNTATWGANIAGGGSNKVLAVYNGTNWTVAGK